MHENDFSFDSDYVRETPGSYTAKTFFWMFLGLLTTFGVALYGYTSGLMWYALYTVPGLQVGLLIAELAVVLVLSARIHKLQVSTARILYFVYAILTGIFFSAYFMIFDVGSMIIVFAMTALYFGGMALYGHFTKTDLSRLRPILVGGLIFLIVTGLLSFFLPMAALDRVLCLIGIAVFLGFTAYDTQKIRRYYEYYAGDQAMLEKASIFSALQLYLDFINLFLYLLRFVGRRKN